MEEMKNTASFIDVDIVTVWTGANAKKVNIWRDESVNSCKY